MSLIVQAKGLGKSFSDGDKTIEVLQELSFDLDQGQSLAVTGPSGSGKSTLLNILAGLVAVDEGEVNLHLGNNTFALRQASERARTRMRRRYIGYIYQFFNLVPTLTVLENVCLPARLNKRKDLDPQARNLLVGFGLGERFNVFPEVLSGGEQQRVAVARALLMQPPLILADEPTGNLDATNSEHVASLLFDSARQMGVSLVIATHSDRIASRADQHLRLGESKVVTRT